MAGEGHIQGLAIGAFFLLALLFQPVWVSAQEKRVALVVGIAQYETVRPLKNTIEDSELISRTLESLGFEVTKLTDAGLSQLRGTIKDFAFRAETADVALVYYAGHGMEVGGENLLIPADSSAKNRQQAASTSVSLKEVLTAVDRARQLRIVILDSCRDDPFVKKEGQGLVTFSVEAGSRAGLAPPSPERGTLVAFAAKDGAVALDGEGDNSPFALALAENLSRPDLEIGLMFRQVRDAVLRQTGNRQEPHMYGSLSGDPYFLAGRSQQVNSLTRVERRNAWSKLKVDQEVQLAALADEGDTRALKGLAYMRLDPNERRHDASKAVELLTRAAEAGDPEAQFELARLHEQGIGTEQDVATAIQLYEQSAKAGFADAINDLGFLYFQGGLGIRRDQKRALEHFEQAADLRHSAAMFNFAAMIDDGKVEGKTPKDAGGYLYGALRGGNEDVLQQLETNPAMFKKATRDALQQVLKENGFYDGAIDGQFGPGTKLALREAFGLTE